MYIDLGDHKMVQEITDEGTVMLEVSGWVADNGARVQFSSDYSGQYLEMPIERIPDLIATLTKIHEAASHVV